MEKSRVVILSPCWPNRSSGYGIAVESSIRSLRQIFDEVIFICLAETAGEVHTACDKDYFIPIRRRSLVNRFASGLIHRVPACSVPFFEKSVINMLFETHSMVLKESAAIFIEDIPIACLFAQYGGELRKRMYVRSHNVLGDIFRGIEEISSPFGRLAWRYEIRKMAKWEEFVATSARGLWAISEQDFRTYKDEYKYQCNGVMGVIVPVDSRAKGKSTGNHNVVSLGSWDLRKGLGMEAFIMQEWPKVRDRYPDACLMIGGKGSERFRDSKMRIEGVGFVSNSDSFVEQGDVFINPQLIGSGVKLKSLNALALGRLLISTVNGVSGIPGEHGCHFLVGEANELGGLILEAFEDRARMDRIRARGHGMIVRNYSAEVVCNEYRHGLAALRPSI